MLTWSVKSKQFYIGWFSNQLRQIIKRYKHIGYNLNGIQASACLVVNQISLLLYLISRRLVVHQTQ